MLCLSCFELYSRWVPLICLTFVLNQRLTTVRVFCELILLRNSFFVKQNYISLKEAFLCDARTRTCLFLPISTLLNTKIRLTVLCLIGFKQLILVGCRWRIPNASDKKNPLWSAIQEHVVSACGFTGFVWTKGLFVQKRMRFQTYPDSCEAPSKQIRIITKWRC